MANYRKSFNLRNGVQVDEDNFIVNANGLVGIGTSIPREFLDVRGNVQVVGLVTTNTLYSGIATVKKLNVSESLTCNGIITATSFSGSAAGLTGILAIAVDGWNVKSGTISTTSKVGIGTTNPIGQLQIGTGITFNSNGNATYSGIITASQFDGLLNSSDLTGTIDNTLLPTNVNFTTINATGIVTASQFTGNLVGIASTANSITNTANIKVNSINSGFSTSGISTVHNTLHVIGNTGIGTVNPNAQIHLRKSGISSAQLTSDGSNPSIITFGRSVTLTSSNAQLRFGNTNLSFPSSTEQSLDVINYDTGNLNFYLNPGGSGAGSYNWFKPSLGLSMTLNGTTGNLGINSASPSSRLSVVGDAQVSGAATISNLTVQSTSTLSNVRSSGTVGIATNNPIYTLQVGNNPSLSNGVGISSSGNMRLSGIITAGTVDSTTIQTTYISNNGNIKNTGDINAAGIMTALGGFSTGDVPVQITVSGNDLIFTIIDVGSVILTLT
jgi:hypothetical protein